jgi:hypothetical protein
MHIEPEHRLRQLSIAPPDTKTRYVVMDRPLAEKAGRDLIEKYDCLFTAESEVALKGDGRSDIHDVDLRAARGQNQRANRPRFGRAKAPSQFNENAVFGATKTASISLPANTSKKSGRNSPLSPVGYTIESILKSKIVSFLNGSAIPLISLDLAF